MSHTQPNADLSSQLVLVSTPVMAKPVLHEYMARSLRMPIPTLHLSKGTVYEAGVRGSAFVWSSLLNDPGRVSMEMMHITDWFPTLYHAIGGSESVLPKMDGMNVWNSIQGNSPSPRNEFVPNINPILNLASVRVDDWKLLY
ncbi:Arylsulfatase I, partial [Armadillidium vulgare]